MASTFRVLFLAVAMVGCGDPADTASEPPEVATTVQPITGQDGNLTVNSTIQLNQYSALAVNAAVGATTITVADITQLTSGATQGNFGPLTIGDQLMVIQMRGATISTANDSTYGTVSALGGAGNYELVQVAGTNTNVITITSTDCSGLRNAYTTAGRAQVVRVPQINNLTVDAAGQIVPATWNGTTGGVVALHVGGTATINGSITASGFGFRGGATDNGQSRAFANFLSTDDRDGGAKGESIAGDSTTYTGGGFGKGAPANAGGGGNGLNGGGGGGGANGNSGVTYTGAGVMDTSVTGGAAAWPDDPENGTSSGGGRGGYTNSTLNADALTVGPNNALWGGDLRKNNGGRGGHPLTNDPAARLFLGGGGGAGEGDGSTTGAGGNGGGIVVLIANSVTGSGLINANGAVGVGTSADGGGGGGGGGSIVIKANTLAGVTTNANGGVGGSNSSTAQTAQGPGAGGGGGFIATSGGTITTNVNGALGGTTPSSAMLEFPTNGASKGGQGNTATVTTLPICLGDLSLTLTDTADPVVTGAQLVYTIAVTNNGPNAAIGLSVKHTLPIPDVSFVSAAGTGWACTFLSPDVTCTRAASLAGSTAAPDITVTTNVVIATGTTVNSSATLQATTADSNIVNNTDSESTVIQALNDPPVNTVPGPQATSEDTPLTFAVSIADPDAGAANVQVQLSVTNGTLTIDNTGLSFSVGDGNADATMTFQASIATINLRLAAITYTPTAGFGGNATFTIVTNDLGNTGTGGAQSDTDNVTISVAGINNPPVNNVPGTQTTPEDTAKSLAVSITDPDAGGGQIQVAMTVTNGTLSMGTAGLSFTTGDGTADPALTFTGTLAAINTALGSLSYTPTTDFTGNAVFSITTNDQGNTGSGGALTDSDNVTIQVTAANDPPNAVNDTRTVNEDSVGTFMNPLNNDTITPDVGETLTVISITQPANGSASIVNANTNVAFTPNANFNGSTSFQYTISDGNGGTDTATVSITVSPINDSPDAVNDTRTVAEDSGASTITVLANDTIAPDSGETLSVTAVSQPANGVSAVTAGGGSVTFTPNANFNGLTTFTYTISDGNGGTDIASVSVTVSPVNDPPNAVDDSRNVAEDSAAAAVTVLVNDTITPDSGETLSITNVTQPAGGTVVITGGGTGLTFQPTANFTGATTFNYTISDGNGGSDTATVTMNVGAGNDPPTANDDTLVVDEDAAPTISSVLANDSTLPDTGETLTVSAVSQPATGGTAAVTAGGGSVTFTPAANFNGSTSFTYTISDGNGGVDFGLVSVTVNPVNDPPNARDDVLTVAQDAGPTALNVLANDTALPDTGETLTITAVTQPAQGAVAITGGGTALTFDPPQGFTGLTSFTYTIEDGNGLADTATVAVGVGPDSDGDFLPDPYEVDIGTSPTDADTDDDGLKDGSEPDHAGDTDGDGLIDALDPDADNDGLYDGTEAGFSTAGAGTDPSRGHFIADADTLTKTDPIDADSDNGGVKDGAEDANRNGKIDGGETNPNNGADDVNVVDTDDDGLSDPQEGVLATNANDADTDEDGVLDGDEPNHADDTDGDGLINAKDTDSDGDFVKDGTELGVVTPDPDTNVSAGQFVADQDPGNTTSAVDNDTDDGGATDGEEDANRDGKVDDGERDPNDPADDDDVIGQMDEDADGVRDDRDNCPDVPNPDQADIDNDEDGDACDADANGGGLNDNLSASGGGCSTNNEPAGAAVILFGLALLLRRRRSRGCRRKRGVIAIAVLGVLLIAPAIAAAQSRDETRDFSVERFQLASDRNGLLGVEWAESRGYLAFDVALWLGYANDPLVVSSGDERVGALVADRTAGGLVASISPAPWVSLGFEMPVVLSQGRDKNMEIGTLTSLEKGGSGSLRLIPKLTILSQKKDGIGLAVIPAIKLPTRSSKDDYLADDGVTFAPEVAISRSVNEWRFGGNIGYHIKPKAEMLDLVIDDEVFARLGVGYRLPMAPIGFDAMVSMAFGVKGEGSTTHVEGMLGANVALGNTAILFAGAGSGFAGGFGTPDWRMLGGVRVGAKDRVETETAPDIKPNEIDTDSDGVMDWRDNCKDEPEDKDNHKDGDGCPDADNDGDSVLDPADKCRDEAGVVENNGCPGVDADVDGVFDHVDKCPAEAEDHDSYQDEDGCPEADNDSDGVSDALDACPTSNGPVDNGGCPDPDRDGDTVVDRLDNCPDVKGEQLNAGCTTKQLVAITPLKLATREQVEYNRAAIAPKSNKLLDNIAAVLVAQPKLIIEVGVFVDDAGDDAANKTLTQKRADAVVAYLVKKGADATRLVAVGYGEEQPEGDNKTRAGRLQNRRTVFKVIGAKP